MFSNQNESQQPSPQAIMHGGHELFDVYEVLNAMIGALNQCVILCEHIQDSELLAILDRQYGFMLDEYNITAQAFRTGQDPQHPTRSYKMQMNNTFEYGVKVSDPKKPFQSTNEIDDAFIAGTLLGVHKAGATAKPVPPSKRQTLSCAVFCEIACRTVLKWPTSFRFIWIKRAGTKLPSSPLKMPLRL